MDRIVSRGLKRIKKRMPETITMDEKSVGKEYDYITLVNDGDRAAVDYIENDRKQENLHARFSEKKRTRINTIPLSFYASHPDSIRNHVVIIRFELVPKLRDGIDPPVFGMKG